LLESHAAELESIRREREDEVAHQRLVVEDLTAEKESLFIKLEAMNQEISKLSGRLSLAQQELEESRINQSQSAKGVLMEKERLVYEVETLNAKLSELRLDSDRKIKDITLGLEEQFEQIRKEQEDEREHQKLVVEDLNSEKEELLMKLQSLNQELSRASGKLLSTQQELDEIKWNQSQASRGVVLEKEKLASEVEKLTLQLTDVKLESERQIQEVTLRVDEHLMNEEKLRKERDELDQQVLELKQQIYKVRKKKKKKKKTGLVSLF